MYGTLEKQLLGLPLMLQALGLSCKYYNQFANFELIHTLETYGSFNDNFHHFRKAAAV